MRLFTIVLCLLGISSLNATADSKKNILFIVCDDLRPEINSYSRDHMITPNIDTLSGQGVQFDQAYCNYTICAASRASFLTGTRPDTVGVTYPYSPWFVNEFLPDHPTFNRYLFDNGYWVRTYGKLHHGPDFTGNGVMMMSEDFSKPRYTEGLTWANPENQISGPKPHVEIGNVDDDAYREGKITNEVLRDLDELAQQDKPFLMSVGFWLPHLPFNAPKKYWDMYDRDKLPMPEAAERPEGIAPWAHSQGAASLNKKHKYILPEDCADGKPSLRYVKESLHAYAACVSYLDAQMGRIFDKLKQLDMWDDTVVILTSDHGYHLGEHDWWAKHNTCEYDARVPFIVRYPGTKAGYKTNSLAELIDLFPTLCDAAQIEKPDYLEGTSLVPLLSEPERPWKKAAFTMYRRPWQSDIKCIGRSMRTDRFRYTEWRKEDGTFEFAELYDHQNDPIEAINVIKDESYAEKIKELAAQLKAGWKAALPEGIENNSDNPTGDFSFYMLSLEERNEIIKKGVK